MAHLRAACRSHSLEGAFPAVGARTCDEAAFVPRLRRHHILLRRGERASGRFLHRERRITVPPGAQRGNRGLA
jgi:hypothetical protein